MIFKAYKESIIENHKKNIDLLIQANQGDGGLKMYSVLNRNDIYQVTRFIFGKLFGMIFSYFFSDFIIKAPILLLETTYLLVKSCRVFPMRKRVILTS
jgi:hypothetical protein